MGETKPWDRAHRAERSAGSCRHARRRVSAWLAALACTSVLAGCRTLTHRAGQPGLVRIRTVDLGTDVLGQVIRLRRLPSGEWLIVSWDCRCVSIVQ
jgi:hypothetical protein